jgi:uncharacterized protein
LLTADLVDARRRSGRLHLRRLDEATLERARGLADELLTVVGAGVGARQEELLAAAADIEVDVRDRRLLEGLKKLTLDRCRFEMRAPVEPATLRREVFERAARARRESELPESFDRAAVLDEVGQAHALSPDEVEELLYADRKQAHRLISWDPIDAAALVTRYERGQAQAVLLKATRVTARVTARSAQAARALLGKLKFLRLLATITREDDGRLRLDVDGPFSLFSSVTKYGLQLALLLPALDACGPWELDAIVLWGPERHRLAFSAAGGAGGADAAAADALLSDDVEALVMRIEKLDTPWEVAPSTEVLDLPGVGLCVPDLVFTHQERGARVFLEVMGFWSREAVWRRVELVEAGLPQRVVFAVSERLRVSEAALGDELPGALYVYKGVMNARRVLEKLDLALAAPLAP